MDRQREPKSETILDEQTCTLICPISAAMIGVCLTTIGLTRIIISVDKVGTNDDELFFIASMVLLAAICVFITYANGSL